MFLPGNVACPNEATYEVISATEECSYRRQVCLFHLVPAIDADMRTRSGVRVTMTAFEEIPR
jgi:hypothetical protein